MKTIVALEDSDVDKRPLGDVVAELAELDAANCSEQMGSVAKDYGVPRSELARLVKKRLGGGEGASGQGTPIDISPPEMWPEPVDGAALATEMRDRIARHVWLQEHAAEVVTLWILHTHVFSAWRISPRLFITSPEKGCGKSTLLNSVIAKMVSKPLLASNISPAAIFRVIESAQPCLLIDEADTFIAQSDDLRGVLNSSHSRDGAFIIRVTGDDHEPRRFSTWSPIAIAGIGGLPDTLEDRSLKITMMRRTNAEPVADIDTEAYAAMNVLARKAARWAEGMEHALADHNPETPEGLTNRLRDNWLPLLAVADAVGGDWPDLARAAACHMAALREEQSAGVMLLQDIYAVFESQRTDRLSSSAVVDALVDMEERPWAEWKRGKPLTKTSVARLLKPYGITSRTIRLNENQTLKGYTRNQFSDAVKRYVEAQNPENGLYPPFQNVTPSQMNEINDLSPIRNVTEKKRVTFWNGDNPLKNNNCDGVTFQNRGEAQNTESSPNQARMRGEI